MSKIVPLEGFGGGGSSPLNFKIVAYATEEELAAAQPKENTIGVVTTTPINGWIFGAKEPIEPVEGMVWIYIGITSLVTFNALKENALNVYPISAKQYLGDAWVEIPMELYQNDEWKTSRMYLYNRGDKCTEITGGYREYEEDIGISFNADNISFGDTVGSVNRAATYSNHKINVTGLTKLYVVGASMNYLYVGLSNSNSSTSPSYVASMSLSSYCSSGVLDVSNLTGEYYLAVSANYYQVYGSIHEIYLT